MIFQWESPSATAYLRQLFSDETIKKIKAINTNFSYMDLLSIGNGAIRPAGESYRDKLASGEYKIYGNKELDEFMKPTLGYMVYQEQIIEFLHKFCGFTMGEADVVRRCVDENTLITLDNGEQKRICDIKVGDIVQTFDNTRITNNNVTNVFDNGYSDVYDVICENQYAIRATKSHKVLTQRGYVTVGELTDDDYLFTPTKLKQYCDGKLSNQRLSQSDMFLIGMLLGDGTIGGNDYSLHFTNSDLDLIDTFKRCVNNRLRKNASCKFRTTSQPGVTVDNVYNIYIDSKEYLKSVYNLLNKLGISTKAKDKHIPTELMNYPIGDKLTSLLAGLFSTDGGYITSAMCIEYYSISKTLADNIKNLLLRYEIYSYVYTRTSKEYGYDYYTVRINQRNSLEKFLHYIVPLMQGIKKTEFTNIINGSLEKDLSYNYTLPKKYIEEMCAALNCSCVSMRSINAEHLSTWDSVTDTKALRVVQSVYCPETYKLLLSDYEPIKLKSVKYVGKAHVYDIEVENTHNYIANGIVVHNCFAKKTGTQDVIPIIKDGGKLSSDSEHYIKGFIQTMYDEYSVEKEEAENLIGDFLQVIIDASDYLFSKNHADPYSWIGYICGYLRYYYPLEFITVALNIFEDKEEKSLAIIDYAKRHGITISPIKFRHSEANYNYDKNTNEIFKGISSIKYMNAQIAREMYDLKDNEYESFIGLLYDLKEHTSVNSRQLKILIDLDFFEEFGDARHLMKQYELFAKFYGKSQYKKETLEKMNIPFEVIKPFAGKETDKMFTGVDSIRFLEFLAPRIKTRSRTLKEKIEAQREHLGYIDIKDERYKDHFAILEVDTKYSPKIKAYSLRNGEIITYKINKRVYSSRKLSKGDIVYVRKKEVRNRVRKTETGFEDIPGVFDTWWTDYERADDL